jgi:dienelactone hydrolase
MTAAVQVHSGTADRVTPPGWAEEIRDALRYRGKEVEFYSHGGQGHAFHGESWQLFMERVTRFYDRHFYD